MKTKTWDALAIGSLGGAAAASAALYGELPERVATHFDLHGTPNGWMSRPWAAFFVPVFGLAIWALTRFAPRILPTSDKKRLRGDLVALVSACTAVFMAAIHLVILRFAVAPSTSVLSAVYVVSGALFVVLGLVLPRVRRNPIIGIRTAWTLRSDENWARTQRVGGMAMVVAGIGTAVLGGFGGLVGSVLALACLIVSAVVPIVYSLVLARRSDVG